jgi:carbamoyltransferase
MIVLGFSVGHDKGAVLIKDGKVLIGISQERLTRRKNDGAYSGGAIPTESIVYCLSEYGLTMDDVDLIVYSTTEVEDNTYEKLNKVFKVPQKKLKFIPHHLAHAYSSFFSSGMDEAAVIVADASGSILNNMNKLSEWYPEKLREGLEEGQDWTEGIAIYHMTKDSWTEVYKKWIKYPVPMGTDECTSVGTMYSQGSLQLIYEPSTSTWSAGKLMGMASYADKKVVDTAELYAHFTDETETDICIPNNVIYPRVHWKSDFYSKSSVAGIYQREQERISLMLAKIAKNLTNSNNVCTSGGSFLNCNSNEKILHSGLFEKAFFIPPADDSGIPLGCAWYAYQQVSKIKETELISPYFGKNYENTEIWESISKVAEGFRMERFDNLDELVTVIADRLSENRVVGWFQNGSEIGPRALGNRSILASPIPFWMKDHINHDIKKREWYRPFAPAVLFERQGEIFELDYFSPHMLVTTQVNEEWKNKIPAVTHVDGSARYQSVTPETNERFYRLISKFNDMTGVPVLLNTSFNGPGEPIVETPLDAFNCFVRQNIDVLVIGDYVLSREN